jgi:hypothetical protein
MSEYLLPRYRPWTGTEHSVELDFDPTGRIVHTFKCEDIQNAASESAIAVMSVNFYVTLFTNLMLRIEMRTLSLNFC